MKYLKLYESFEDIDGICKKYGITNYSINTDGSIDVEGDVFIRNRGLTKLPLKFRNVTGYFDCSANRLTSLEGAPNSVGGHFYCDNNRLTSLEGAPESVTGNFYCYSNHLTSLEGVPNSVGGYFDCSDNLVYNVWKLFNDYSKVELLNDYDIFRDGNKIVIDRLNDFLLDIGKKPVEKVDGYISTEFNI